MPVLLWDASALAKRYAPERGSDVVDTLFERDPSPRMVATVIGYAECYSILRRKFHRGGMDAAAFRVAKSALRDETVVAPDFHLITVDDPAVFDGIRFMDTHNLNATDAAILTVFLSYQASLRSGERAVLVASDHRLLKAAQDEGMETLDPEVSTVDHARQILTTL